MEVKKNSFKGKQNLPCAQKNYWENTKTNVEQDHLQKQKTKDHINHKLKFFRLPNPIRKKYGTKYQRNM